MFSTAVHISSKELSEKLKIYRTINRRYNEIACDESAFEKKF